MLGFYYMCNLFAMSKLKVGNRRITTWRKLIGLRKESLIGFI